MYEMSLLEKEAIVAKAYTDILELDCFQIIEFFKLK